MHGSLSALSQHDTASYYAYVYGIPIRVRDRYSSHTRMGHPVRVWDNIRILGRTYIIASYFIEKHNGAVAIVLAAGCTSTELLFRK